MLKNTAVLWCILASPLHAASGLQGGISKDQSPTRKQIFFLGGLLWWIISETPCWTLPLGTTSVSECFIWTYETLSKHSRPACVGGWLPHWIECKHLLSDHLASASPRMGIQGASGIQQFCQGRSTCRWGTYICQFCVDLMEPTEDVLRLINNHRP